MRKMIIIILLVFSLSSFAEVVSFKSSAGNIEIIFEDSSSGSVKSETIINEIATRLEKLENKYVSKLNKLDQKKATYWIDEIYALLALLPDDLSVTVQSTQNTLYSQEQSANLNVSININEQIDDPLAMSNSEFQSLLNNVKNESFADDQTSVVRIATKNKYFSISQLITLLDVFSFSDDKINIVRIVFPVIIDKDNAHNLLGAFTYSDDKDRVEQIISQ